MSWKLGSLFDGSGGFPLAGSLCDIEPRWASEVEPYPIAVTRSRFPNMIHLGDISKINGAEIEPVDVITFGSPCQDLSVAGKRAGLKHEANGDEETTRSGLFMEAVRIIKEMREATNGVYPRFALWENVPGAFSSNKGEDFRIVLEELIKIIEPTATMPEVPKNGWAYADSYIGNGWSIAYRVFDAQYWGVPQRRRRIHLVADFRGECAREVLFEREGLRGYFAQGGTAWESLATYAERGVGADHRERERTADVVAIGSIAYTLEPGIAAREGDHIYEGVCGTLRANAGDNQMAVAHMVLDDQGGQQISVRTDGKAPTLRAEMHGNVPCVMDSFASGVKCYESHPMDSRIKELGDVSPTVSLKWHKGAADTPLVCYPIENHPADSRVSVDESGKVQTLTGRMGTGGGNVPMVMTPVVYDDANITSPINASNPQPGDPCHTLSTDSRNYLVYCLQGNGIDRADTAGCNGRGWNDETCYTLNTIDRPAVAFAMQGFGDYKDCGVASGLKARDYKDATDLVAETHPVVFDKEVYNSGENATGGHYISEGGPAPTLRGTGHAPGVCVRYIVRRLTPTECARLQGFADCWGHIEEKNDFTEEEYRFWLEVRNTHAEINGKVIKDYTKKQMLTWYNKLHTDSAEYKMWGNGIALPPALYCMQGITDVLRKFDQN